jgi:lambda family phage minor tail protein L
MVQQPKSDLFQLNQDAIIPLYILDLKPIGVNAEYQFCNEKNTALQDVKFQGRTYIALPIEADGFEMTGGSGRPPTPTLTIANVAGTITSLMLFNEDLRGAKVWRKRTLAKHLDGGSQPNGYKEFAPDIYYVERKSSETRLAVTFELKSAIEYGLGAKIPRRQLFFNQCLWRYRSSECSYAGPPVADINDNPTSNPALDQCGKRVKSCQMRFGQYEPLPYGGFPGIDQFRG